MAVVDLGDTHHSHACHIDPNCCTDLILEENKEESILCIFVLYFQSTMLIIRDGKRKILTAGNMFYNTNHRATGTPKDTEDKLFASHRPLPCHGHLLTRRERDRGAAAANLAAAWELRQPAPTAST